MSLSADFESRPIPSVARYKSSAPSSARRLTNQIKRTLNAIIVHLAGWTLVINAVAAVTESLVKHFTRAGPCLFYC
jgi:hypothetical protein